ncbi:hypothetical protein OUZ56_026658 [Daphnia magna]|uniref:Uncharacterized protein n=1 Tax=Daphnia magna TaxID=35525 RepID=A0ABQ9ZME3_9CRUS|nr:hypothetical protein OUZ56_026658 [Daphnia magna]
MPMPTCPMLQCINLPQPGTFFVFLYTVSIVFFLYVFGYTDKNIQSVYYSVSPHHRLSISEEMSMKRFLNNP